MKRYIKYLSIFMLVFSIFVLTSCTYINSLMRIAEGSSQTKKVPNTELSVNYYVDDVLYKNETTKDRNTFNFPENPKKEGYNFGGWTYKDSYQTLEISDLIYKEDTSLNLYAYFSKGTHFKDNLSYNGPYFNKHNLPSFGSPKVLVVPVDLGGNKTDEMLEKIEVAFTGKSDTKTGFESVSSYYSKSSFGKLNLQFEVLKDWFKPAKEPSYYEKYDLKNDKYYETGSGLIYNEFLYSYKDKIDFSQYDYDKDGYIDSVWMIYNVEPNFSDTTFYWAYVTFSQNTSRKYNGCYPRNYAFASYYFIEEKALEQKYGKKLEVYDTLDLDAHTYIHETGHLLGLNDYYDSDSTKGKEGGIYSAGMMDANQGDLNTIDKLLLGWVDPYVVYPNSDNFTYTIGSFTDTNDVILIAKNKIASIYNEYFLMELYTNTGLNEKDKPIEYPSNNVYVMEQKLSHTYYDYGIRLLHINAATTTEYEGKTYNMPMTFLYNNSTTRTLFADTVVAGYNRAFESFNTKKCINNYALFRQPREVIYLTANERYKMTNNSDIFFNFQIDSLSSTSATITFIM